MEYRGVLQRRHRVEGSRDVRRDRRGGNVETSTPEGCRLERHDAPRCPAPIGALPYAPDRTAAGGNNMRLAARVATGLMVVVFLGACFTTPQEEVGNRTGDAVAGANDKACDEAGDVTREKTAELEVEFQQDDHAVAISVTEAAATDLRRIADDAEGEVRDAAIRLADVWSNTAQAARAQDAAALATVREDFMAATTALAEACGGTASEA